MINFNDNVDVRVPSWKAKEPVSAKKLNAIVDAVNRMLVASAAPPRESIVRQQAQSPVLYVCTTKTVSDEESDFNRLVGARRVLRDGTEFDTERFYPSLLNQDIGVGEYVIPVRSKDDNPVWASCGIGILEENAEDFTYAGEHVELALTDTGWDRYDPPEDEDAEEGELGVKLGLKITQSVGLAYYHDGDKKIYGYVRDFIYDSSGKLVSVSAETRIVVEVPTDCTG